MSQANVTTNLNLLSIDTLAPGQSITISVKFSGNEFRKVQPTNIDIEFDGGLLKVSSRSGRLTWYGMESKSGNENP